MEYISQNIHRVGNDYINGMGCVLHHVLSHILQNIHIGLSQVQAAHAGLSGNAAGDHNNIRISGIFIIAGTDDCRRMERCALINIQRLTEGFFSIDIHQNNLGGNALHHQVVGNCRAHTACADHTDLTHNHPLLNMIKHQYISIHGIDNIILITAGAVKYFHWIL